MTDSAKQAIGDTTHFGFRTVDTSEKSALVRAVFDSVAPKYDVMNDLMSAGVHRLWKGAMIETLAPQPGWQVLDVAGGTGDIAVRILKRMSRADKPTGGVAVCDINESMIRHGRDRALDKGLASGLNWSAGDAQALPFPDMHFDAYTIAFGLRNVTDIDAALSEAKRVLKPGGRFLCLEFSHVAVPGLDRLYDAYSFTVLPALGGLVAGDRDSYRYLAESIRRFPDQNALSMRMKEAGFASVRHRNLSGGIAALHSGWRI